METLKMIALTILSELFIYYLITIYLKYTMGYETRTRDILNPFVPWISAIYFQKFSEGCDCYRKKPEAIRPRDAPGPLQKNGEPGSVKFDGQEE